ncbi:MAG TPA: MBL fold metallo-hydrolase [Gemmatimonadales bacterium]|nr:MBL fold metallo-hydrolase [Gemmatimonadales bacterium]
MGWPGRDGREPAPALARPESGCPEPERPRATPGALTATWVGHSTVLLQLGPINVLTDPVFSDRVSPVSFAGPRRLQPPGLALEALPPLDLLLLSHDHYDHLDAPSVRWLAEHHPAAQWRAPLGVDARLRALGVTWVRGMDWWETEAVETARGVATVACTPAKHFSSRGLHDRNRTLWSGFAVAAAGRRVYFAGDTGDHPEFGGIGARHGPFDLMLVPVGAYAPRWVMRAIHLDPEEAARAVRTLLAASPGPAPHRSAVLPIHWGTFHLTDEPVDEPPRRFRAAWRAAGLPEADLWLLRHGETRRLE